MRSYAAERDVVVDVGVSMETYEGSQAIVSAIPSAFFRRSIHDNVALLNRDTILLWLLVPKFLVSEASNEQII